MQFSIREVIENTGGILLKGDIDSDIKFDISTDTRKIKESDFYLPLRGENYDGHSFIDAALKSGAIGYFTQDKTKINDDAECIIYVENTLVSYLKLANYIRRKINPKVVAITGSSGKTTVKEMLYGVLSTTYKTHKTALNHNNEIGLCQTLSSLENDTKYLIVEMGMRGLGEIELLSKYAQPDIAVIVNVGSAHIGRLGSLLNIAKAKFEITKYLNPKGILISHRNELIEQINDKTHQTVYFSLEDKNLEIKEMASKSCRFEYKNQEYKLNVGGEHNIQNALSVVEAGLFAGLTSDIIAKGLEEFAPIEKRWDIKEINGFKIINDSYNSNPESVKAALKTFLLYTEPPKSVVLGDMGELGLNEEEYHNETGKFLEQFECDYVLTIGELAKHINPTNKKTIHFDNKTDLVDFIKKNLPKGSNILLKASRFMKFEEIIEELDK